MTKRSKIVLFLLIGLTFIVLGGTLSGCKPPIVPTDRDIIKTFQDNRAEFCEVVKKMMAEENQNYTVRRNRSVTYPGAKVPPVSAATINACSQIMQRTFCTGARRADGVAQFIFFEEDTPELFRSKCLLYDMDNFTAPQWQSKTTESANLRYTDIQLNWKVEYRYEMKKPK